MYDIIKQNHEQGSLLSLNRACSILQVSRCGYDRWMKRKPCVSGSLEMNIRNEMQNIAVEFPRYGYRRMTKELQKRGFEINHKRALKLMKIDNLICVRRMFRPITTDSNHNFRVYPNLVKNMDVIKLNQLWVSDITYIRLIKEFIYLAVIIDVFSRKCIGWKLGRDIDTQLTLNALNMALSNRKSMDISDLIHHSDRGIQYAAGEYIDKLNENKIKISMSRKGNPYDNAFAESFMKTLKYEEVYLCEYESFNEAHANIKKFIEDVYNQKRLHSSIGYLPPNEFERRKALNKIVS